MDLQHLYESLEETVLPSDSRRLASKLWREILLSVPEIETILASGD
jgi:hypothetical protein